MVFLLPFGGGMKKINVKRSWENIGKFIKKGDIFVNCTFLFLSCSKILCIFFLKFR